MSEGSLWHASPRGIPDVKAARANQAYPGPVPDQSSNNE
jgi:hypothetical protein